MSDYEIAALRLDSWLLIFTGVAALANGFALVLSTLNIRWLAKQSVLQQGALRQQILASEVSLLIHEKSLIDPKSGLDAQVRLQEIDKRLIELRSEVSAEKAN